MSSITELEAYIEVMRLENHQQEKRIIDLEDENTGLNEAVMMEEEKSTWQLHKRKEQEAEVSRLEVFIVHCRNKSATIDSDGLYDMLHNFKFKNND